MRVIMEIREEAFRAPKTRERVAEEMRQAAAVFWVARGDVAPEAVTDITAACPQEKEGTLMDLLLSMPDVGKDADFERPRHLGRELPRAGV
jgi:hypothetical protein